MSNQPDVSQQLFEAVVARLGASDQRREEDILVYQYSSASVLRSHLGGFVVDPMLQVDQQPFPELWATSSSFLNDREEFVCGHKVYSAILNEHPNREFATLLQQALDESNPLTVYCSSFSAVEDDLSQWRGYGDDGRGVCIGYDLKELNDGLQGVGYWVQYGDCGNETTQLESAQKIVTDLIDILYKSPDMAKALDWLRLHWPIFCLQFKNTAFESEREFRVVYSEALGEGLKPCFGPDPMRPFVKLRMRDKSHLPVREVWMGPAVSEDHHIESVQLALLARGVRAEVRRSKIPYIPQAHS